MLTLPLPCSPRSPPLGRRAHQCRGVGPGLWRHSPVSLECGTLFCPYSAIRLLTMANTSEKSAMGPGLMQSARTKSAHLRSCLNQKSGSVAAQKQLLCRGLHTMTAVGDSLFLFAGAPKQGAMLGDLWRFDTGRLLKSIIRFPSTRHNSFPHCKGATDVVKSRSMHNAWNVGGW